MKDVVSLGMIWLLLTLLLSNLLQGSSTAYWAASSGILLVTRTSLSFLLKGVNSLKTNCFRASFLPQQVGSSFASSCLFALFLSPDAPESFLLLEVRGTCSNKASMVDDCKCSYFLHNNSLFHSVVQFLHITIILI